MHAVIRLVALFALCACSPTPDAGRAPLTQARALAPQRLERVFPLASLTSAQRPMIIFSCLPSPAPTATPSPGPSAPGYGCESALISGTVYGPDGGLADNAIVTVNSLEASAPYTATVTTGNGLWVINSLPYGTRCEILIGKDNWVTERQIVLVPCIDGGNGNINIVSHAVRPWPVLSEEPNTAPASATASQSAKL